MSKKKFMPILGDLSKLTEPEREDYVLAACEFLQVPPELGLVVLSFMDDGDGARKLVLYVKKGATDIIRDRRKINVDSLTELNGDGYVGFTAVGHDAGKRQEIAVGAVSIKGLTGQAVANAVMTAQTKAMRRLTLQFAGGGFLDETEVVEKTVSIANAASSLKEIAQPTTAPSAAPGKDITPAPEPCATIPVASKTEPEEAAAGPEPRRKRHKKTVSLDPPKTPSERLQEQLEPLPETKPPISPEIIKASDTLVSRMIEVTNAAVDAAVKESVVNGTPCTPEQRDGFRKRFSLYVNDTLPKAGFLQSAKLGSRNDKLTKFVQAMFPNANVKHLSLEQWTHFFAYMDAKKPEELVKIINKQIGEEA